MAALRLPSAAERIIFMHEPLTPSVEKLKATHSPSLRDEFHQMPL